MGLSASSTLTVFLAALGTALATGLGAIPLRWVRHAGTRTLALCNAAAAGVMAGASVALALEGAADSVVGVAGGVALGLVFLPAMARLLPHDHDQPLPFAGLRGGDARRALIVVAVMTVHSAAEGIGVGSGFAGGGELGWLLAVAIAVHNIPEGLAISLVMVPRGASVSRAAGWSVFSSLPQPLLAVPAFLFVEQVDPLLPVGLGFAAGAMVWMVGRELLPEAVRRSSGGLVAAVALPAGVAMVALWRVLDAG